MIHIAIIEDCKATGKMLQYFFEKQEGFEVVFRALSVEDIPWEKLKEVNVVLCDIGLPGESGIEATRLIKKTNPKAEIVMFTGCEESEIFFQCIKGGASGYLLKTTTLLQIKDSLVEVLNGGSIISPTIAKKIFDHFKIIKEIPNEKSNGVEKLTPREFDILTRIQTNPCPTYRKIAGELFISLNTVKFHIRAIYKKLQVKSRMELLELFR